MSDLIDIKDIPPHGNTGVRLPDNLEDWLCRLNNDQFDEIVEIILKEGVRRYKL